MNGVEVQSGEWSNTVPIIFILDGLSIGTYTFKLVVFDFNGLSTTDEVIGQVVRDISEISATSEKESSAPIDFSQFGFVVLMCIPLVRRKYANIK